MSETNSKRTFSDLLSLPDKGLSLSANDVAVLVRTMCLDLRITNTKWETLSKAYFKKVSQGDHSKASSDRNNLKSALAKDSITWAIFVQFTEVIRIDDAEIYIKIPEWESYVADKEVTEHRMPLGTGKRQLKLAFIAIAKARHIDPTSNRTALATFNNLVNRYYQKPGVVDNPSNKALISQKRANDTRPLLKADRNVSWKAFKASMFMLGAKKVFFQLTYSFRGRNREVGIWME